MHMGSKEERHDEDGQGKARVDVLISTLLRVETMCRFFPCWEEEDGKEGGRECSSLGHRGMERGPDGPRLRKHRVDANTPLLESEAAATAVTNSTGNKIYHHDSARHGQHFSSSNSSSSSNGNLEFDCSNSTAAM